MTTSPGDDRTDPQQVVINDVNAAFGKLSNAVDDLKRAVGHDAVEGAKKGGRELKLLADLALDLSVQTTGLKTRLELEKSDPTQG
jgi:hypothetical protein